MAEENSHLEILSQENGTQVVPPTLVEEGVAEPFSITGKRRKKMKLKVVIMLFVHDLYSLEIRKLQLRNTRAIS